MQMVGSHKMKSIQHLQDNRVTRTTSDNTQITCILRRQPVHVQNTRKRHSGINAVDFMHIRAHHLTEQRKNNKLDFIAVNLC